MTHKTMRLKDAARHGRAERQGSMAERRGKIIPRTVQQNGAVRRHGKAVHLNGNAAWRGKTSQPNDTVKQRRRAAWQNSTVEHRGKTTHKTARPRDTAKQLPRRHCQSPVCPSSCLFAVPPRCALFFPPLLFPCRAPVLRFTHAPAAVRCACIAADTRCFSPMQTQGPGRFSPSGALLFLSLAVFF